MSDLIAPWQSVHLHQLTLSIENQLCEGEQLRWGRTFWQVGISVGGMPQFFESLGKEIGEENKNKVNKHHLARRVYHLLRTCLNISGKS